MCAAFERLFRERGLPQAIRSDNGVPFASPNGLFNLSKLSVWCSPPARQPRRLIWEKKCGDSLPEPDDRAAHVRRTLGQPAVSQHRQAPSLVGAPPNQHLIQAEVIVFKG